MICTIFNNNRVIRMRERLLVSIYVLFLYLIAIEINMNKYTKNAILGIFGIIGIISGLYSIYLKRNKPIINYNNAKFIAQIVKYELEHHTNIIFLVDNFWTIKQKKLDYKLSKYIIDIDESDKFMERIHNIIQSNDFKSLDIIMNTTGGDISSSDVIMKVLLNYKHNVNIHVPCFAFSAGSMITLCANNIYMNEISLLSPIDPQMTYKIDKFISCTSSSKHLSDLLKNKTADNIDDTIYLHAIESRYLHNDNIKNLRNILHKRYNLTKKNTRRIIKKFASGLDPHHMPINVDMLKDMNIPIKLNIPERINKIFISFVTIKNQT